MTYEAGSMTDW